eukprot:2098490-Pleurochrysis_carterae.AAC.4
MLAFQDGSFLQRVKDDGGSNFEPPINVKLAYRVVPFMLVSELECRFSRNPFLEFVWNVTLAILAIPACSSRLHLPPNLEFVHSSLASVDEAASASARRSRSASRAPS